MKMTKGWVIVLLALASTGAFAQKDAPNVEEIERMQKAMTDAVKAATDAQGAISQDEMMKNLRALEAAQATRATATLTLSPIPLGKNSAYKMKIIDGHRECILRTRGPAGMPTPATAKCDARFREMMEQPFWKYVVTDTKGNAISCPASSCKLPAGSGVLIRAEGPELPRWEGNCASGNLIAGGKVSGNATCMLVLSRNMSAGVR